MGIFNVYNGEYTDNISSISITSNSTLKPDIEIQQNGLIWGWIDIVGFKNSVVINNNIYIYGNPNTLAIVKYDAGNRDISHGTGISRVPGMDSRWVCYWCTADSLEKDVTITKNKNKIIAFLNVTFRWHETIVNSGSSQRINYVDTATFQDSEPIPLQYPSLPMKVPVTIFEYNGTVQNTAIQVGDDEFIKKNNISKIKITYNDNYAERDIMLAYLESNKKNITIANLSVVNLWRFNKMSRLKNIVIFNSSNIDYTKLKIEVSNIYETMQYDEYNVSRIEFSTKKTWNPLFFIVLFVVLIIVWDTKASIYRSFK